MSDRDARSCVVTVQAGGSRRPFFYVHVHWDTGAFYCFTLADALGADQPFYVLEPYTFDGLRVPPTLEAMARAYVGSMRSVQPEGPYALGGFCGGGLIAFEMARQLRAEGQAVAVLVLIEPGVGPALITTSGGSIRRVGHWMGVGEERQLEWFLRLRHVYRLLFRPLYRHSAGFSLLPGVKALREDWMGIFVWMVSGYVRPQEYEGKVMYMWARDDTVRRKAWPSVAHAREEEGCVIAGEHLDLISGQLGELSVQLRKCLEKERLFRCQ